MELNIQTLSVALKIGNGYRDSYGDGHLRISHQGRKSSCRK